MRNQSHAVAARSRGRARACDVGQRSRETATRRVERRCARRCVRCARRFGGICARDDRAIATDGRGVIFSIRLSACARAVRVRRARHGARDARVGAGGGDDVDVEARAWDIAGGARDAGASARECVGDDGGGGVGGRG